MADLLARITKAVRLADRKFEQVGGSSRHWVRECLLPGLETEGLAVVDTSTHWVPIEECGELEEGRTYLVLVDGESLYLANWQMGEWLTIERIHPSRITHVHQMGPIRGPGETP